MVAMTDDLPWVEKYRPSSMDGVVLDETNQQILNRVIESCHIPHLLFYGPPGTGKTTAAINLVDEIHARHGEGGRECLIHLNASDERGVDVVRQQIARFVRSNGLFKRGARFVILDEVDYMTKCAQQRLRTLIQTPDMSGVRFCLICNYATRIDASLREEFVSLRFNRLPRPMVIDLLRGIVRQESMDVSDLKLNAVCDAHGSDVRSMINHLQTHQDAPDLIGNGTHVAWCRVKRDIRTQQGVSAKMLRDEAHNSGLCVSLFIISLMNHAIRDSTADIVDKKHLMELVETMSLHYDAEDDLLSEYCALALHRVFSPQRSAR